MTELLAAALLVCRALFFSAHRLVIKQSDDRLALLAGFNLISMGVGLSLLPFVPSLGWAAMPYLLASATFYSLAMVFLTFGYRLANFSAITPLQSAIKIVSIAWLATLLLGEPASTTDWLAAALVVASLGVQAAPRQVTSGLTGVTGALAVAAGLCSGSQYIADVAGIRRVDEPMSYIVWNLMIGWPVVLYGLANRRSRIYSEFRRQGGRILTAAGLDIVGYSLILIVVYQLNVVSILPLLNLDILFSALLGILVLRERHVARHLLSATLLFTAAVISQVF